MGALFSELSVAMSNAIDHPATWNAPYPKFLYNLLYSQLLAVVSLSTSKSILPDIDESSSLEIPRNHHRGKCCEDPTVLEKGGEWMPTDSAPRPPSLVHLHEHCQGQLREAWIRQTFQMLGSREIWRQKSTGTTRIH
mmetsp:Transcript_6268/g.12439  ORF Transcript_6268/g.12439 Transcript_6268/m.12439 type:complete len:137 (-) Transcript_6268:1925-2335(-)